MDGVLPVWKERGLTSHDVVYKVRKLLQTKKVGHTGTLDPDVDGVLPLCINQATKIVEHMMDGKKIYSGEVTFGFSTTTEDASGDVVERQAIAKGSLSDEDIDSAMKTFLGHIQQIPPMYSAIKVNGKRLYEYARQGIEVERPIRQIHIYRFERTSALDYTDDKLSFRFEVECSRGTYVRTLAVDLGRYFGLPAHMSDLTRTQTAHIHADHCFTLDQIAQKIEEGRMDELFISIPQALADLDQVEINDDQCQKVRNGGLFSKQEFGEGLTFPLLLIHQGEAVAIYDVFAKHPHLLKPQKLLKTFN